MYSIHYPGLSLLIALPVKWYGVLGAKSAIAALLGLLPFILFSIADSILGDRVIAVLLALMISIGLPFAISAAHLYPDMIAGLLIVCAFERIRRMRSQPPDDSALYPIIWIVCVSYLPWLHLKNVPPALLLIAGWIYCAVAGKSYRRSFRWNLQVLIPLVSLALFLATNMYCYKSLAGPYNSSHQSWDTTKIGTVFLGLLFDQGHGLLLQQPLFFLSLLGLGFFIRNDYKLALFWTVLCLFLIVPNSTHPNWYGGWSPSGRFMWSLAPLWIYPLVYFIKFAYERDKHLTRSCTYLLFPGSLVYQLLASTSWLPNPQNIYNSFGQSLECRTRLLDPARWPLILPSFNEFGFSGKHSAACAAAIMSVLVILLGFSLSYKCRLLKRLTFSGTLFIIVIYFVLIWIRTQPGLR